jgi:hypothetical protein
LTRLARVIGVEPWEARAVAELRAGTVVACRVLDSFVRSALGRVLK